VSKTTFSARADIPDLEGNREPEWGSDYLAELLRATGIEYLALNPGASFRGLHDSLVNYLGNQKPAMLLCLHEEHTVAIAQGYAKVTGRPMGAFVHANVGLMHASMAVFNAWCDRLPVLLFGATGPMDAAKRRPWIDWIHTAKDQGSIVRDFTKWDDQPTSLAAAAEAVLRANVIARTAPCGPVYVVFDADLQEQRVTKFPPLPDLSRFRPAEPPVPSAGDIDRVAALLAGARKPVILAGRVSRSEAGWQQRVALAELLSARVLTDQKLSAAFPTAHPLHAAAPSFFFGDAHAAALRDADVILSLDWLDLAGSLRSVWPDGGVPAKIIQISQDQHLHRGSGMEYQGLAPIDIHLACEPDAAVPLLLAALRRLRTVAAGASGLGTPVAALPPLPDRLDNRGFAITLRHAFAGKPVSLIRANLSWPSECWPVNYPLDYLGYDGGGGVGSGPGNAVGAALALADTGRIPLAVLGDGDFVMGGSAVWTAVHHRIPLLIVVANNRSFYNDEVHQERVARTRKRPVKNKWIGQRIAEPELDIAGLARAQGAVGLGPAQTPSELLARVAEALERLREGQVVVIDARVTPEYGADMSRSMTRSNTE
jgi:thiamine pyrophosphate-dependent acetolactate synthase large subunit-like protein